MFFQAEDGIRDVERSRGLGDVYKRQSQNFGFSSGRKIRLTFRIDKQTGGFLTETPLSADQRVKDCGDEYEISATVIESAMLEWWIAHFGEDYQEIDRTYLDENA